MTLQRLDPDAELPPYLPGETLQPIVLGVDPGTRVIGYGAVVIARSPRLLASGVLRAEAKNAVPARLGWLGRMLEELFARLRPQTIVVEQAFSARNVQSALRIGESRGVVLAAAAKSGAEVVQYAPAAAKKAVTGNGGASKEQVARMVSVALSLTDAKMPLDATDALALALAHLQRSALERSASRARSSQERAR
jgi:crossover junction endodeoxyribonuclease RuvC